MHRLAINVRRTAMCLAGIGTAVFAIEVARLYIVFQGPAWLLGYAEFPQSGFFGSVYIVAPSIALLALI